MLEFILNIGVGKFLILCITAMVIVITVLFAVLKILNEASFKIGNVAINLKNEGQRNDIVNLVFDYGAFQDAMNDTRDLAIKNLQEQSKRYTKLQLKQYIQRLRGEYAKVLDGVKQGDKQVSTVIFNLFTKEVETAMFAYLIEIYEKNHLSEKTTEELKILSHNHYDKLADMFKDHAAAIWLPVMQPYSMVYDISMKLSQFAESIVFDVLSYYSSQSRERIRILDVARKISLGIKNSVAKSLKMPDNACYIAENFYSETSGLNKELIKEYLEGDNNV